MEGGRKRLSKLKDAGLDELNISTGDFHQQFVPQQAVVNAALLGCEAGLNQTLIVIEMKLGRKVSKQTLLAHHPELQRLVQAGEERFKIIESPWMPMNIEERIDQERDYMLNSSNVHLREGCASLNSTIVLAPTRKVGLCCGLTRERIPELNEEIVDSDLGATLARASKDFMKIWLTVEGPERILAWAASKNPAVDWENRYSHHCHACLALFDDPVVRQTIRENYRERVQDVLMRYVLMLKTKSPRASPASPVLENSTVSGMCGSNGDSGLVAITMAH